MNNIDADAKLLTQFQIAIELLGGNTAAATAISISERTLRRLASGASQLHAGFMRDTANALELHAEDCLAHARHIRGEG